MNQFDDIKFSLNWEITETWACIPLLADPRQELWKSKSENKPPPHLKYSILSFCLLTTKLTNIGNVCSIILASIQIALVYADCLLTKIQISWHASNTYYIIIISFKFVFNLKERIRNKTYLIFIIFLVCVAVVQF